VANIEVGNEYDGIVRNIVDFGVFVQLVPGTDGLLHISAVSREKQRTLSELLPIGSTLKVRVTSCDLKRGRISLVAPELE
jgi:polyribonucleotide nucleotidyltransferase